jgi:putative membrane protein
MKYLPLALTALLFAAMPARAANLSMAGQVLTQNFVIGAAIADMYELQAGKLALARIDNEQENAFASRMVAAHQKTAQQLRDLVRSEKIDAVMPENLNTDLTLMYNKLEARRGGRFADLYIEQQIQVHQDTIQLFERYVEDGRNERLKTWAGKVLPILRQHLDMARALKE